MLFSYPLEGELENSTGYLATLPLEQYGASVSLTEATKLSQATDNYALAAVKVSDLFYFSSQFDSLLLC